jgi:hypothetical protein
MVKKLLLPEIPTQLQAGITDPGLSSLAGDPLTSPFLTPLHEGGKGLSAQLRPTEENEHDQA